MTVWTVPKTNSTGTLLNWPHQVSEGWERTYGGPQFLSWLWSGTKAKQFIDLFIDFISYYGIGSSGGITKAEWIILVRFKTCRKKTTKGLYVLWPHFKRLHFVCKYQSFKWKNKTRTHRWGCLNLLVIRQLQIKTIMGILWDWARRVPFCKPIWLESLRTRKYYPTFKFFCPKETVCKKKNVIFAKKFMAVGLVRACENMRGSETLNFRGMHK